MGPRIGILGACAVGGQIAKAWDIPAVHTARPQTRTEAGVERPEDSP